MKKIFLESKIFTTVLIALTALAITASGIMFEQNFFHMLPLYVSLIVFFLQSKAMRLGSLMGSLNSVLYGMVYLSMELYGSMFSALAVSFPLQLATFISWSRRKSGNTTRFRTLSSKWLIIVIAITIISYFPILISSKAAGGNYVELDSAVTALGFTATILMLLRFSEYVKFQIAGLVFSILLFTLMVISSPEQLTYLIYNVYATICCVQAAMNISIIKKRQTEEDAKP